MVGGKSCCSFQSDWQNPSLNPEFAQWVREIPKNPKSAFCAWCKKNVDLSTMGRQALLSHLKSKKHVSFTKAVQSTQLLSTSRSSKDLEKPLEIIVVEAAGTSQTQTNDSSLTSCVPSLSSASKENPFVINESVVNAEIQWALKCVASHFSYRSCSDMSPLFQSMFPDSSIASKFSMGKTKLAYLISFGLAPYFLQNIKALLSKCDFYVICFDESLNKVSQQCQMDILIRYFDSKGVQTRYLTSVFLGHTTAADLLKGFLGAIDFIDKSKILQICMDGPNVNIKFVSLFEEYMLDEKSDKRLLDIGTCSLHVIHNAFKAGCKASGWDLSSFLHAIYYLFKDSPARRSDFITLTGSSVFPKKFCGHRWLENSSVVERAIVMLPGLKTYVKKVGKRPTATSFDRVENAMKCIFLQARLEFFKAVSCQLEPFLTKFQSDKPMAPYIYEELTTLVKNLAGRIINPHVLDTFNTSTKLMQILDDKSNLRNVLKIDIGFGARKSLPKNATELQKLVFYNECSKFVTASIAKILERCPLKLRLTKSLSFCLPNLIKREPSIATSRLKTLLDVMLEKNRLTSSECDRCMNEFLQLIKAPEFCSSAFNDSVDRLDVFWSQYEEYGHLTKLVRMVLSLSHGNAVVESGFSVNDDLLVENLQEKTLVNQRLVYDAIKLAGGHANIEINKVNVCWNPYSFPLIAIHFTLTA